MKTKRRNRKDAKKIMNKWVPMREIVNPQDRGEGESGRRNFGDGGGRRPPSPEIVEGGQDIGALRVNAAARNSHDCRI